MITENDLARRLQDEIDNTPTTISLADRLKAITVKELESRPPVVAESKENLREVAQKMIKNQFTKLIVVGDKVSMKFDGTVDMLDLVGEIFATAEDA